MREKKSAELLPFYLSRKFEPKNPFKKIMTNPKKSCSFLFCHATFFRFFLENSIVQWYINTQNRVFSLHFQINTRLINIMTDETGIRAMPSLVFPPFPETQPTDAWIKDEEKPTKFQGHCLTSSNSSMSYNIPHSFLWSPLTHQRTYHIRSVFEGLAANMSYLVFELEKLRSSFPLDPKSEDAHKEEKLLEKTIENVYQMSKQVRKSKKEFVGMLEDGLYVNPRQHNPSKYSIAASLPFAFSE